MVVSCMLIDEQKASLFTRFTGAALRKARGINNSRIGFPKISTLRTRLARVLLMVSFFLPFYAAHSAATVPVTSFCYQLASACNQSNQQSGVRCRTPCVKLRPTACLKATFPIWMVLRLEMDRAGTRVSKAKSVTLRQHFRSF